MRKLVLCAIGTFLGASVALATAAGAQDAGSAYLNAGFQRLSVDTVTGDIAGIPVTVESSDHNALVLRGGYDIDTYFGAEAEIVWGLGSENLTVNGVTVPIEVSVNHAFGAFGKAQFPIAEGIGIHGRLGFVSAEGEATATSGRYPGNRRAVRRRAGLRLGLRNRRGRRLRGPFRLDPV